MRCRYLLPSVMAVLLAALLVGCGGSSSNQAGTPGSVTTNILGTWTIVVSATGFQPSTIAATVVSSPCTVPTPIGSFTVTGPTCFIADNNSGQGLVSGSGSFVYPPQGVLMGVAQNPALINATVDMLFVEADQFGDAAVFDVHGTVSNGTVSGSWSCDSHTAVCAGESGTFTGTKE